MTLIRPFKPAADESAPHLAPVGEDALQVLAEAGYAAAFVELADPDPFTGYRAVARLSGHLAVTRRAVLPAARHWLTADHDRERALAAACLAGARQIEWALRLLEGRLAGEACAARLSLDDVLAMLDRRLTGYRTAERALLAALRDRMPGPEHDRLARRSRSLLPAAPTRPHPRCPRSRLLGPLAFRFLGGWDRLLDTLDSRPGADHHSTVGHHSSAGHPLP